MSKKIIIVITVIAVAVVLIAIGAVIIFNEPDEFANWKTYRNEEYGFEFKYPSSWKVNERLGRSSPSEGEIKYLEIEPQNKRVQGKDPEGNDIVKPGIVIYESKVSYEVEKEDLKYSITGDFQDISIDDVNGVKKFGEITEHLPPFGNKQIVIILNREDAPLVFGAFPYDEEILNQILSTFKFLEPNETANWKTYRNEEHGFEFKYPEDWKIDQIRTSSNEIVFDISIPESREAIKFEENTNNSTLEQLKSERFKDQSIIISESQLTVDEEMAYKIEISEFGQKFIIFLHDNFIYTITTGGRFISKGILSTFKFID